MTEPDYSLRYSVVLGCLFALPWLLLGVTVGLDYYIRLGMMVFAFLFADVFFIFGGATWVVWQVCRNPSRRRSYLTWRFLAASFGHFLFLGYITGH